MIRRLGQQDEHLGIVDRHLGLLLECLVEPVNDPPACLDEGAPDARLFVTAVKVGTTGSTAADSDEAAPVAVETNGAPTARPSRRSRRSHSPTNLPETDCRRSAITDR